ncbi:peptidase associated/transthyretin-like domain-containing protein [Ekhidna sp.]
MKIHSALSLVSTMLLLNIAQAQKIIEGYIQDEAGNPIAFATIGIEDKNIGTYSFEDGSFSFIAFRFTPDDSLTIRHIAYEAIKIRIPEVGKKIILQEKETALGDVVISPQKTQLLGLFKKKSASSIAIDLPFNGAEVGTIIQLPENRSVIERLMVNVSCKNLDSFRIRASIYGTKNNKPAELLYQTKAFHFEKKDGVVELNLDKSFEVPGSVFLSFEWLVSKEIAQKISNLYQYKRVLTDSIKTHHKGSVNIYNNKKVEIVDSNGVMVNQFKLNKKIETQLESLARTTPKIRFSTTKKGGATYYRSYSLGKWYPYQQSLIAGIEISQFE